MENRVTMTMKDLANRVDGSLEWKKWYGNSFVLSTHLNTDNGMVYSNNSSEFCVGLDVHTGEEKFKTTTGGSASKIAINDGRLYMSQVSAADDYSHLMSIDGTTGEILIDIKAPFWQPGPKQLELCCYNSHRSRD